MLAQRVRQISPLMIDLAAGVGLPSHEPVRVGLSLGLALAEPGESFEQVVERADVAMYEDKRRQHAAGKTLG
jgi:predicted signal transduction protein with EAL and GGDEF domain